MRFLKKAGLLISILGLLVSCASTGGSGKNGGTSVGSAFGFNSNLAPKKFAPPDEKANAAPVLNPMYMRTQADYYFAMAETYSLEGEHDKAIEAYKLTLIYDPKSIHVRLKLASEYIRMGLVSEAITEANHALEIDSTSKEAHLLLGGLYTSLKMYSKAEEEYTYLLKEDPKNLEVKLYMGALLAEQKDYTRALKIFKEMANTKSESYNHVAHYYIGRIYLEEKKYKLAEKSFNDSLKSKPDFLESLISLGALFEELNKTDKAIRLYSSFQRSNGPNAHIAEILGRLYLDKKNVDKALEQFEIMAKFQPDNLNVRIRIALILMDQKKYKLAIKELKKILQFAPTSDRVRFYLGALYEEIQDMDSALGHFLKVPASSVFFEESMVHAAYIYKQKGSRQDAIQLMNKSIKDRPDIPRFYAFQATLFDELGMLDDGLKLLKNGEKKFPDDEQILFFLGSLMDKKGNKKGTIERMKKVLEINPSHVQALNYLAYTWAEMGIELEEAEKLARKALQLKPGDPYIQDTVGWILFKRANYSEAVKTLEAAYKIRSNEAIIAEHLGDAYYQFKLLKKARDMYVEAKKYEKDKENMKKLEEKVRAIDNIKIDENRKPASAKEYPSN